MAIKCLYSAYPLGFNRDHLSSQFSFTGFPPLPSYFDVGCGICGNYVITQVQC